MYSSLIGNYYGNHLLEIPLYGKVAWPFKAVSFLGTIAGYWYLRKNNIDFWAFADLFAPALILAQSVGRMAKSLKWRCLWSSYGR